MDGALPEDVSTGPEMNQYFYAFALVPILDILGGKINYDYWNTLTNTSWKQVYMDEFEVGTVGLISAVLAIVFCEQWEWVHDVQKAIIGISILAEAIILSRVTAANATDLTDSTTTTKSWYIHTANLVIDIGIAATYVLDVPSIL